jgi:nondiscriminating aspartyl-tRNA synthetase
VFFPDNILSNGEDVGEMCIFAFYYWQPTTKDCQTFCTAMNKTSLRKCLLVGLCENNLYGNSKYKKNNMSDKTTQWISSKRSEDVAINDSQTGQSVEICGMVYNSRITKWGGFIIIRKPQGLLQTVFQNDSSKIFDKDGNPVKISDLSRESSVKITGTINAAHIKDASVFYKTIEISIQRIDVLSTPETAQPIDINAVHFDSEANFTFKLDHRQVTLRNPRDMAIFKINAVISKSFADYLTLQNFTQIFTPKIVSEGAEGGANVFALDYFGKQAYLAQSPQFYKQICVGVFERVFEIAPAYRAEKHSTSRHLNEYISLDIEMGFINGQEDVMQLEAELLRYILTQIETHCRHELSVLQAALPQMPERIPVYKLSEVHEILHQNYADKLSQDHRAEPDLAPEEEVLICDYALKNFDSDFVFVTHFPSSHRAFYAMDDPTDATLTLSFDLLMRGKEITSGGERIHEANQYREKMRKRGMNPDNFKFYLDTFANGMPPHGGLAIGLERLTTGILQIANVKEASLFPRDIHRIAP